MDKIQIRGGKPLSGTITIGGSKNASLPVMCASLLTDEPLILGNVPHIEDLRPDNPDAWTRFEASVPGLGTILERLSKVGATQV